MKKLLLLFLMGLIPFVSFAQDEEKDEKIMAEYNYEKFKETFEAEMEKLGN